MSQHDMVLSDAAGVAFRVDLNAALSAIASNNSGLTEPSTTYAYQWWVDTTTGWLKRRNAANSAWISVMDLTQACAAAGANSDITSLTGLTSIKSIPVRQTVLFGPVDSNGLPAFGGSTGATSVATTAISGSAPLVVAAANGSVDILGQSTANLTFTGLSSNGTMYMFVDIAAGVMTPGTGTVAPTYQPGGTYSTTANKFTFNYVEMVGKVGNGASAVQTSRVYLGQVTVAGGVVTAIVWYALQGKYIGPYVTPLPGAAGLMTQNHNIGDTPEVFDLVLENITTEFGYAVGSKARTASIFSSDGSGRLPIGVTVSKTAVSSLTGSASGLALENQSSGVGAALTAANWKYKFIASRGW